MQPDAAAAAAPIRRPGTRRGPPAAEFLTRAQLAVRLGVTLRCLELWARAGEGPPRIRLGPKRVLYRACDVETWLEARTERGATAA